MFFWQRPSLKAILGLFSYLEEFWGRIEVFFVFFYLSVMYGVSFDDIEQGLLPDPILLLEELVFRVGPGNIPPDDLDSEPRCVP